MTDFSIVNTRAYREKKLDDELAALETDANKPQDKPDEPAPLEIDPNLSKAEQTWQKRYSDLRSHAAKKEAELAKKLADKDKLLEETTKQQIKFPKSASMDDVMEWAQVYPDLAGVMEAIADYKASERTKGVKDQLASLDKDRKQLARERAEAQILKAHNDFLDLVDDPDFQTWVENQPIERGEQVGGAIYNALYVNETDSVAAIKAIDIYKQDMAMKKKPRRRNVEDAAEAMSTVRTPSSQIPSNLQGKRSYLESEIDEMDIRTYERLETDIEEARREGRITYDISGMAR